MRTRSRRQGGVPARGSERRRSPEADGLAFRCRYVGTTLLARHSYVLPRAHSTFGEAFELLREAVARGLVVEVTTENEPDEDGALTVSSVSLNGREPHP